ncbi:hypothetical protein TTRE_0000589101 [Trichuris trichiura]|uniref:Uncharacterized protein n=1 Tax=Trichuris trichiura TaxID=36087 RepID=A0A077ZCM1_TRITR|nr:hypothetical protein TTRE_0000589101 [Trichuris trichiura]
MLKAFPMDKFVAYKRFVSRKLEPDEAHDVFVADLRQLASLAGSISDSVSMSCVYQRTTSWSSIGRYDP